MPKVSNLKLPDQYCENPERQATHEDYTLKAIVDSDFTNSLRSSKKKYGINPNAIADLVAGSPSDKEYFIVEGINYFPILSQLISGEMDSDRMDYLLRDSYFCRVSYGKFDLDWIIDNLDIAVIDKTAYLALTERAVRTFDDFLLSRFHMFMMVYFHYRAVCLEKMLYRYFDESNGEYTIPSSIEEYVKHDDNYLLEVLKTSSNPWAQRITNNKIPPKIFESFGSEDRKITLKLQEFLKSKNIDYIFCESNGRLSKYYSNEIKQKPSFPIKVFKKYRNEYIDIDEATELYKQFSESHGVCRIHTYTDQINQEDLKQIHAMIS